VLPEAVQECVAVDLDFLEMLRVIPKRPLQSIAAATFVLAQECHVMLTVCVLKAVVYQATWLGDRPEISVDTKADACVQAVDAEAHLSVQQELQPTAVSYFVHSVLHNYQMPTAASYVIIAQAAILVADTAAMSTAAAASAMWHLKAACLHAHVKQKSTWQQHLESTVKKVLSWPILQIATQSTINGLVQEEWDRCMLQRIPVVGQQVVLVGKVAIMDISLAAAMILPVAISICHTGLVLLLHSRVQMYVIMESVADQELLD
jgi:hypothetical protein